jgi:hypothetical protein
MGDLFRPRCSLHLSFRYEMLGWDFSDAQLNSAKLIGTAAGSYNGEELVVRFSATNGPSSGSLNT